MSEASNGRVEHILIAPGKHLPMRNADVVQVRADLGLVGDRFFGKRDKPGRNLTLIEAEAIAAFNASLEQHTDSIVTAAQLRRNIVTSNFRLNDLIGVTFRLGQIELLGVELCEPCRIIAGQLADTGLKHAQIIKHWTHRAGLRAQVLSTGLVQVGDSIQLV